MSHTASSVHLQKYLVPFSAKSDLLLQQLVKLLPQVRFWPKVTTLTTGENFNQHVSLQSQVRLQAKVRLYRQVSLWPQVRLIALLYSTFIYDSLTEVMNSCYGLMKTFCHHQSHSRKFFTYQNRRHWILPCKQQSINLKKVS